MIYDFDDDLFWLEQETGEDKKDIYDKDDWFNDPSLTAEERNPSMVKKRMNYNG
jgi:hypothetical protein